MVYISYCTVCVIETQLNITLNIANNLTPSCKDYDLIADHQSEGYVNTYINKAFVVQKI